MCSGSETPAAAQLSAAGWAALRVDLRSRCLQHLNVIAGFEGASLHITAMALTRASK